jgi:hypothetical protein
MFKVGQNLFALTEDYYARGRDETDIYLWEEETWRYQGTTGFIWNDLNRPVVIHNGSIYSFGQPSENASDGIYRSDDLGKTWQYVVSQQHPTISALHIHDNMLLAGTYHDTEQNAHLYRVDLSEICNHGDMDCDGDVNRGDVDIVKSYRNQSASECPKCDLDFDGRITILDMRKIIRMCSCPQCICP